MISTVKALQIVIHEVTDEEQGRKLLDGFLERSVSEFSELNGIRDFVREGVDFLTPPWVFEAFANFFLLWSSLVKNPFTPVQALHTIREWSSFSFSAVQRSLPEVVEVTERVAGLIAECERGVWPRRHVSQIETFFKEVDDNVLELLKTSRSPELEERLLEALRIESRKNRLALTPRSGPAVTRHLEIKTSVLREVELFCRRFPIKRNNS